MQTLLILLFYRKNDGTQNIFLESLKKIKEKPSNEIIDLESNLEVFYSFEKLINSFKKDFDEEMITLLFYTFIQENQYFSNYLLGHKDPYLYVSFI